MTRSSEFELKQILLNEYIKIKFPDEYQEALNHKEDNRLKGYPVAYLDTNELPYIRLNELEYLTEDMLKKFSKELFNTLDCYLCSEEKINND